MLELHFEAPLWRSPGGDWHFVTLPEGANDVLRERGKRPGFGSVRVEVTVGATTWQTSVFPDSAAGAFVLPVKKAVRIAEGLQDGQPVAAAVRLAE